MSKHIELAKKLKALADRGVGGEKRNAQEMLRALLKKHKLTIEDIEEDKKTMRFFKSTGIESQLLHQIIKRVNYDLKVYEFTKEKIKKFGLSGNTMTECTDAEYIEIDQMFQVFKRLYKEESDIFYSAFLTANDLLARPPKGERQSVEDMTPEEREKWERSQAMARSVKKEIVRKQLGTSI